jgi:hypothetical protein
MAGRSSVVPVKVSVYPAHGLAGGVLALGPRLQARPVLFAVGVGLLAASTAYSAYDRYFNQDQSGLQALLGGAADATGISAVYAGITGRDLATQHHLSLTPAQQRQMLTEGSIQAVGSALVLYGGVRSFLRGRVPVAPTTGGGGTVRVFRVEGTPNARIAIGEGGTVAIAEGDKTLFLNFGDKARAEAFLAKRLEQGMPGAGVKSFEVPKSFLDELRSSAVPEALAKQNPGKPIIVDVTKAPDQFGLRPEQIEALKKAIIQGSGKTGF